MQEVNFLNFPIWWYTVGLGFYLEKTSIRLKAATRRTGLKIFARHLFQPLYGDRTRSGLAIGVFLRFFILLGLLAWVAARWLFAFILLALYILILPISVAGILILIFS